MDFSKLIHFIWFQGIALAPATSRDVPAHWQHMNHDYEVRVWDEQSLHDFIVTKYPQYLKRWHALPQVIKKCDMARLLLIHHYGGVYLDMDLIPQSPLHEFFDQRKIYHMGMQHRSILPNSPPVDVDFASREFILSREYANIDYAGCGVANGVILSKAKLPMWIEFVEEQIDQPNNRVLEFMGPHALTRFLRRRAATLNGRGLIVPPYYFLWEDHAMKQPAPSWCVSKHLAVNHWGDHTKPRWWEV